MTARPADRVAATWPELVRYAALLTADVEEAAQVAGAALVRTATRRPLHRGAEPDVHATVVKVQIGRWRRHGVRLDAEPAPEVTSYDGTPVTTDAGMMTALQSLPPGPRAAVLLRYLDRRDDAAVAAVIGGGPGRAAQWLRDGVSGLRRRVSGLTDPETDLPRLLAQTAAAIPVRVDPPDPHQISSAARLRQFGVALAGAALVAAAIAGIVSLTGSTPATPAAAAPSQPTPPTTPATRHPAFHVTNDGPVTLLGYATGVASGFHSLWLGENGYFMRLSPDGRRVLRQFHTDRNAEVADIRTGAGRVWLLLENAGIVDEVMTFDPAGHATAIAHVRGLPNSFSGSVFWHGSLWVPAPAENIVLRLTPTGSGIAAQPIPLAGAPDIVGALGPGLGVLGLVQTPGLGPRGVWTPDGDGQIVAITAGHEPAADPGAVRALLQAPGQAVQVVSDPVGVFAATTRGVLFFSMRDLRAGRPNPTAFFRDPHQSAEFDAGQWGAAHIAAVGGAVVINDGDGQTWVWHPRMT